MWCPSGGREGEGGCRGRAPGGLTPSACRQQAVSVCGGSSHMWEANRRLKHQEEEVTTAEAAWRCRIILLFQITLGMNFAYISLNVLRRSEIEAGQSQGWRKALHIIKI